MFEVRLGQHRFGFTDREDGFGEPLLEAGEFEFRRGVIEDQVLAGRPFEERPNREQARRWIANRNERWPGGLASFAIAHHGSDKPVGQIGAGFEWEFNRAEAFYWLDAAARGQGLATEALKMIAEWAMADHDIVRVQLITHPDNAASQRVAERSGFIREGVLRAWEPIKDEQPDVVMWSRLASDPHPDSESKKVT